MSRWSARTCCCTHARFMHAGSPIGWTACFAFGCTCPIFDSVWAARFWAWMDRPLFAKEP